MAGRPKCRCGAVFDIAEPNAGCIQLPNELFDETVHVGQSEEAKEDKKVLLDEFYRYVNALINNGSGYLFLHTERPYQLSLFNDIIGSRLLSLIPDDSYYHDIFDINIFDDEHIVFRIQRREREERKSFYSFNTKLSLDKGLHDLTHSQFYGEIKRIKTETETHAPEAVQKSVGFVQEHTKYLAKLSSSQPFALNDSTDFVESVEIQAKQAPGDTNIKGILQYVWKTCKLAQYITAFAKLPRGGLFYVGIAEEESKTGRFILDTVNTGWQKVIDRAGQRKKLRSEIAKAVKDNACFLRDGGVTPDEEIPEDIVEVEFPFVEYMKSANPRQQQKSKKGKQPLQKSKFLFDEGIRMRIMEVRVKPFPGLILFDKEGAELYRLKKKSGKRKRKRKSFKRWFTKFK